MLFTIAVQVIYFLTGVVLLVFSGYNKKEVLFTKTPEAFMVPSGL